MLKTILQFFALGSILFAGQVALSRYLESDTISLTVEVSPELSAYRTEQVIKNAILLDYAVQLGWHETDPVIRKHLVRSMKFADLFDCEHMSEGELVAEAVKIGLPKSDAVVRARLLQRAESSLAALRESQQPTDEDLARYLEAHRDLFMHKPRYSFGHVFLSRARRGGELLDEADRVKAVLESQPDLNPEEAAGLGDSLIRSRPYETRTVADATAAYGQSFAEALTAAPIVLPPIASTASVTASSSRAQIATRAPSAVSFSAIARPIPRVAPVTIARLPFRPRSMISLPNWCLFAVYVAAPTK